MLKMISAPFRSMIVFICVFSILTVAMLPLINDSSASAAENDAIEGTASAMQDAIDDLDGAPGTIYIKAGEFNLGGIVTLHEGVKIIGAGSNVGENGVSLGDDNPGGTTIHTSGDNEWFLIPDGADDCRISSIRMVHVPYRAGNAIVVGHRSSYSEATVNDFVIDNMAFYHYGANEASVFCRGLIKGLVCDSYIFGSSANSDGTGFGYGVTYYGPNDTYYTDDRYMGTGDGVYVERCTIQNTKHATTTDTCGHMVTRYCNISLNKVGQAVDSHGGILSYQKGAYGHEIYNNTITNPISSSGKAICMRGGRSYIFNNTISGYNTAIMYTIEYGDLSKALTYKVHDSYQWNNTAGSGVSVMSAADSVNSSGSYLHEGTDWYDDEQPDGYTPYIYPHPLTPGSSTPTNSAPTVKNDSYGIYQDMEFSIGSPGVLNNDSDPEGDELSAVLASSVSHGFLTLNADGSFNYTPDSGFSGTDSFSYKASDGINSSNTATVTITVDSKATPPLTGTFGLDSGNLTFNDPSNSLQAMRFRNTVGEGTLDSISILFDDTTPNGKVRLGVYADDSGAPGVLLLDAGEATVQDGWVSITGLKLQVEQDAYYWLSYFLQEPNRVRYQSDQPADSHYWVNPYAYGAMPGQYPSGSLINNNQYVLRATVTNNLPVTIDDSYATDQDMELTIGNSGVLSNDNDPEGDVLSAVLVSGTSHGSLTLNADGSFNYTPDSGFSGTDSFSYKASDGINSSKTAAVTITIIAKDNPPIAGDDSYIMEQDTELVIGNPGVLSNDSDLEGDVLSAVLVSSASHGSLILHADGSFNYTPASGFSGTDSFSYKASDGINSSNAAYVTITVIAKTNPPIAGNDSYIMEQDSKLIIGNPGVLSNDGDPKGDVLNTVLVSSVSHGSLILHADGSFNYTPASGFSGTDSFSYKASDGMDSSNTATVTINVSPMNMPDTIYSVVTELVHLS